MVATGQWGFDFWLNQTIWKSTNQAFKAIISLSLIWSISSPLIVKVGHTWSLPHFIWDWDWEVVSGDCGTDSWAVGRTWFGSRYCRVTHWSQTGTMNEGRINEIKFIYNLKPWHTSSSPDLVWGEVMTCDSWMGSGVDGDTWIKRKWEKIEIWQQLFTFLS